LAPVLHLSSPNALQLKTAERMKRTAQNKRHAGFSTLEMLIVVGLSVILTAIAVPSFNSISRSLRVSGDLRSLNGLLAQAKMRAASDFTHARVYADLSGNAYQLQVWFKAGNGGAGCWVADADPNRTSPTCLTYNTGHPSGTLFTLSQGNTFGFGSLTTGPTPGQTPIGQATPCLDNANSTLGTTTACIVFNSRGTPINSTGAPLATGAFYVTNGTVVDGVTVSATGSIQAWSSPTTSANWHGQ
jgi:Tfp pilus assembly protein FimT